MKVGKPSKPRYTKEFKQNALELLKEGRQSANQVANSLGISVQTLYAWKKKDTEEVELELSAEEMKSRLNKALKEVEELRQENEILVKAAAFFVKRNN